MAMQRTLALVLAMVVTGVTPVASAVDVDTYIRRENFTDIQISPSGAYLAATIPMGESTNVAILETATLKPTNSIRLQPYEHANSFDWVNDDRLLISLAKKFGALDQPQLTGELYGLNAKGGTGDMLVGYRVEGNGIGTRIQPKKVEAVAAFLIDSNHKDPRSALVAIWPLTEDPYTRVERMDVNSGRRVPVARSPVRRADFTTDNAGEVRFAHGAGADNNNQLYYRERAGQDWKLVNDEVLNKRIEVAIGFSEDNSVAYLRVEQPRGPDAIVSWNPVTDERKTLLRDEVVDPSRVIYRIGTRIPVGALYRGDKPKTRFFDEASADARLYRSLEAAFNQPVYITSSTRDGRIALVETWTGNNPGDFYTFDTVEKAARHLASRGEWLDIERNASVRPVSLRSRDGLPLHGYLTVPHGSDGRNLPLIVMPHGGPFGIYDDGSYESENQMLAEAGYAVLQINFRGSGNYGRAHQQAGSQQWGREMQDDITDATHWAIKEGIADKDRICLYGASYGAYSAMMGVAREQGLYRCAAGYVGVYDLPMMFNRGDIQDRQSGMTYLREWIGDPAKLKDVSPVNLAAQIKVPVFLAAGGEDKRAPIEHTRRMEAALKGAGVPVESLYYSNEGHGFYKQENQREYYTRLLAFLAKNLGGEVASAPAAGSKGKAP